MVNKILKFVFDFVLRKKLGLKSGPIGDSIKWYESENVWAGIAVGTYGIYELLRTTVLPGFNVMLPEIPESILGYVSAILGGGIVWSRVTAEKKIG